MTLFSCSGLYDFHYKGLISLKFAIRSDRIQFPNIKEHNFDYFEITGKQLKEERRNLTINGKNYRNERGYCYCYYGNDGRWQINY